MLRKRLSHEESIVAERICQAIRSKSRSVYLGKETDGVFYSDEAYNAVELAQDMHTKALIAQCFDCIEEVYVDDTEALRLAFAKALIRSVHNNIAIVYERYIAAESAMFFVAMDNILQMPELSNIQRTYVYRKLFLSMSHDDKTPIYNGFLKRRVDDKYKLDNDLQLCWRLFDALYVDIKDKQLIAELAGKIKDKAIIQNLGRIFSE